MQSRRWIMVGFALLPIAFGGLAVSAEKSATKSEAKPVSGYELFVREWMPQDARSHGGDGLGPVFNDTSCIACHNQGGAGGAGPAGKNVAVVSATLNTHVNEFEPQKVSPAGQLFRSLLGLGQPMQPKKFSDADWKKKRAELVEEIAKVHPGFRTAKSVVLHHFSTEPKFNAWKNQLIADEHAFFNGNIHQHGVEVDFLQAEMGDIAVPSETTLEVNGVPQRIRLRQQVSQEISRLQMMTQVFQQSTQKGRFALSTSQRNATALFGAGLLDSIPDKVLEEQAKKKFKDFPKVSGRVARLPDGKIGRFGWKAQKATLRDFTVTACAVELGLHVPEHPQSGNPINAKYEPKGFDLTKDECTALVDYLKDLPAPQPRTPANESEKQYLEAGHKLFASVGCATCHTQDLGDVENVYSDLLVHDMGEQLGDTGSYGVFLPNSPGGDDGSPVPPIAQLKTGEHLGQRVHNGFNLEAPRETKPVEEKKLTGATRLEWRTPPLWGVRDSSPYMHDGRAKTLEQAIALHGGEGTRSAQKYFSLKRAERLQLQAFLKSLSAPTEMAAK